MTLPLSDETTEVGSYFISNYPPYSFWRPDEVPRAEAALASRAAAGVPLGLYLHIPFCRKRCKFCYFRVYVDKNSRDVERYLAALEREVEILAASAALRGRSPSFVYWGGGTPSYLSERQLNLLVTRLRSVVDWDGAEEVTFECEPGTLTERKLAAIRAIGTTRLSLGIESFSDAVLEENGRAHRSEECYRAYEWARRVGFPQINVDLIAGMVGDTTESWHESVRRTVALGADSVTMYQMELPYNTVYSREGVAGGPLVAGWRTKRAWVEYAFRELEAVGYTVSSAYTLVKRAAAEPGPGVATTGRFVYRDALWHGADLLGTGVASFSHLSGVHFQNLDSFEDYNARLEEGRLPIARALALTPRQRLVRELILQLKLGTVDAGYFRDKFGVDILAEHAEVLAGHAAEGLLQVHGDEVHLSRAGLLRVDSLLESFFAPEHRGARYT